MSSRNIIFLLSLPRSGSTWVQRIITKRKNVRTLPETWLFLSLVFAFKPSSMLTEYNALFQSKAFLELERRSINKNRIMQQVLNSALKEIFEQINLGENEYFLEKTPRNLLILDELKEAFPDATYINLFRDPADILLSMGKTWGGGYTTLFRYEIDFQIGLQALISNSRQTNSIDIYYEDITKTGDQLEMALSFLGVADNIRNDYEIHEATNSEFIGDQKYKSSKMVENRISWYTKHRMKHMLRNIPETFWATTKYKKEESYGKINSCKSHFRPLCDATSIIVLFLYKIRFYGLIFHFHKDRITSLGKFKFTLE